MPGNARVTRSLSARPTRRAAARGTPGPLRIERRAEGREPAFGTLAATYSGGGRHGITHLELVDRSPSGLGALARAPIDPGMIVTIRPEGSSCPWLSGRVTRCTPEGEGYRIGLAFSRRSAA